MANISSSLQCNNYLGYMTAAPTICNRKVQDDKLGKLTLCKELNRKDLWSIECQNLAVVQHYTDISSG